MTGPSEHAPAVADPATDRRPELRSATRPRARLFALCLATLTVAVSSTAAGASHNTVTWSSPGGATPVIAGGQRLEFVVSSPTWLQNGRIRKWELRLRDASSGGQISVMCADDYGVTGDDEVPVELKWDTRFLPRSAEPASAACDTALTPDNPLLPGTPDAYAPNGTYNLQVWVQTTPAGVPPVAHEEVFDHTVAVDNPPQDPTGAAAAWNASAQKITVSWTANPEPDLIGYAIDRCVTPSSLQACTASDWSRVAAPAGRDTTSIQVEATAVGAHRFRVAARRAHADSALGEWYSSAAQTDAITMGSPDRNVAADPGTEGDGPGAAPGGGGATPGSADGGTTGPTNAGPAKPGASRGSEQETDRSGLPARTVQRAEVDGDYEKSLPYGGVGPLDGAGSGPLEIATQGVGMALVPMAMGAVVFVFAMQMRYVSRRAETLAFAGADDQAGGPQPVAPVTRPVPLLSLGAGGSFISNWRRLLDSPAGDAPDEPGERGEPVEREELPA